jgi:hypothetical protein
MNETVLLAAVIVGVAGCAARTDGTQAASPDTRNSDATLNRNGGFYACRADGQSDGAGSVPPRLVSISQEPGSQRVLLTSLTRPAQSLAPVTGSNGQLYANAHFAWRVTRNAIVLTDIDNVQTYACRPVSGAAARAMSRSDATNGGVPARSGS